MSESGLGILGGAAVPAGGPGVHRRAALVSIGDELVSGQTLDTNTAWLSSRLGDLGVETVVHQTVGDDAAGIAALLAALAERVELIVITGGLGPTVDDLTREALAAVTGSELVRDDGAFEWLVALFRERGRELQAGNERQAMRPRDSVMLANDRGTAPGIRCVVRAGGASADVFALPGPPHEMHAMFGRSVAPAVVRPEGVAVRVRLARHVGIGESAAAAKLGDVLERGRNPQVGITASDGVITTRSRYVGPEGGAEAALLATDEAIAERLGEYRFSDGEAGLFERALELLKEQRGAIVTAESCTGGLIASRLTEIAGSSAAVVGGFVVYSNKMKAEVLGVDEGLIVEHGAVSAQVARSLSLGALRQAPYDGLYEGEGGPASVHALAVTGIAGPGGAVEGKPVGTVFVAHGVAAVNAGGASVNDATVDVRRFLFPGDRERVRDRTATAAAAMLVMDLLGRRPDTLLWQVHLDGSHPGR